MSGTDEWLVLCQLVHRLYTSDAMAHLRETIDSPGKKAAAAATASPSRGSKSAQALLEDDKLIFPARSVWQQERCLLAVPPPSAVSVARACRRLCHPHHVPVGR